MNIRKLLRKWDLQPEKGLGQNFLVEPTVLGKIVAAADLTENDVVLEIGAGTGALTKLLAQKAGRVIAVELDQRFIPLLKSELRNFENVTLIQGDILALHPAALIPNTVHRREVSSERYKVVANLPYYITSAVLRHILEAELKPRCMIITVQREVAERIAAKPGEMSLLAVSVQFYGEPEILFRIKSGSFYPSPEVESAVVRIDLRPQPPLPEEEKEVFFRFARAGFSQRRKQLHNALSLGLKEVSKQEAATKLEEADVDHRRRAQTLTVEEWIRVTHALRGFQDLKPPRTPISI